MPALALAVALGLLSCKDDPVRRQLADAGLSLSPDAAAQGALGAGGALGGVSGGEPLIPGLDELGLAPEQLDPGLLPPGLLDAGLLPPELGGAGASAPPSVPGNQAAAGAGLVGKPCASSEDCGSAPLFCIPAASDLEFQSGGPQGGFCSLPCTSNDECRGVDGSSGCNLDLGFCLGLCTPGAGANKCDLERPLACVPLPQSTLGACLPSCTSDAACGPGRFCDLGATGLCRDLRPVGGAVGAACTRASEASDCAGAICLNFLDPIDGTTPVGNFCSANCTFARVDGCGFDTSSSGTRTAACLQAQQPDGRAGDLGFCFPLCDESDDCEQSAGGWVCEPFADASQQLLLGRAGRCLPFELATEPGLSGDFSQGIPGLPDDFPRLPDLISR